MNGLAPLAVDIDETVIHFLEPFLFWYNEEHGTDFVKDDFFSYRWWETLGTKKEYAYAEAARYIDFRMRPFADPDPQIQKPKPQLLDFTPLTSGELQAYTTQLTYAYTMAEEKRSQGYANWHHIELEFLPGAEPALELLCRHRQIHFITHRSPELDPENNFLMSLLYADPSNTHFPHLPITEGDIIQEYHYANSKRTKQDICMEIGADTIVDDDLDVAVACAEQGIFVYLMAQPWNRRFHDTTLIKRVLDWQTIVDYEIPNAPRLPKTQTVVYV